MYPEDFLGIGSYVGEIRQGPDDMLYQWDEDIDGFGNPVGFWTALAPAAAALLPSAAKAVGGAVSSLFGRRRPRPTRPRRPYVPRRPYIPGIPAGRGRCRRIMCCSPSGRPRPIYRG
ncbi:MAG: hypothetical protein ACE5I1_21500 [bacterium]